MLHVSLAIAIASTACLIAAAASGSVAWVAPIAGLSVTGLAGIAWIEIARSSNPTRSALRQLLVAYFWGALAMQGLHVTALTGLKWQHAWQYAGLMALLGTLAWRLGSRLEPPSDGYRGWRRVAHTTLVAQAVLSAVGLIFLVASGKLATQRPDWAANRVFLAAAALSLIVALRGLPRGGGDPSA